MTGFILDDIGRSEEAREAFRRWADCGTKSGSNADGASAEIGLPLRLGRYRAWRGRRRQGPAGRDRASALPDRSRQTRIQMTFLYRLLRAEVALAEGDVDRAVALGREIVLRTFRS